MRFIKMVHYYYYYYDDDVNDGGGGGGGGDDYDDDDCVDNDSLHEVRVMEEGHGVHQNIKVYWDLYTAYNQETQTQVR